MSRGGTLYDSGMGRLGPGGIGGGSVKFNPDGSTHTTIWGYDQPAGRFSWNTDAQGNVIGQPHFTDQGYPKEHPLRHPFGR
jgi:hypothetical protein